MNQAMDTPAEPSNWNRGRVGMASLILAESSFFAVFLVAYLFYIGRSLAGPYPADVLEFPFLATVCLLTSSVTIVWANRQLERGRRSPFAAGLFATIALGGGFIGFTAIEWQGLIFEHNLTVTTNLFGTTFYALVGFHAAHVLVGLALLTGVLLLALRGHVGPEHAERVELLSWYWHFVDVVWLAVMTVVYIVGV